MPQGKISTCGGGIMNRLIREQVRSILSLWGFWSACAVVAVILVVSVIRFAGYSYSYVPNPNDPGPGILVTGGSRYALFVRAFEGMDFIFPLACSLAVGASFAIDRKTKVAQYILTRGFRKWRYLLAKGAAMILCSMLLIVLVQGVTWIASSALARYPTVQSFETAGGRAGSVDDLFFHQAPGQYTFMIALLQLMTAGTVATIPLLAAALGGSSWVAVLSTPAAWLLAEYAFNGNALVFLYPGFRATKLWWDSSLFYKPVVCPSVLQSSFAYWGILLLGISALSTIVYLRQEDA